MDDSTARPAGVTRRSVLAGAVGLSTLAGCLGGAAGDGGSTAGSEATPGEHAALDGLDRQPRKGPEPAAAGALIVAFEDPSCTRCRAFERETVPRIEAELVESGRAAFVFRGYPVIYPWGGPATHALEATFARDAGAHWALKDHYYATQPEFSTDNVLARTREFLAAETAVDADAVVTAVEGGETDPAVQLDLDAGMAAGAGRTTPHVFLFRDGEYVTKAAGSVSFSVVKNALGL